MSRQRFFDRAAFLRDLGNDRAERHDIREERLRSTAGMRGTPAIALSAWRGRSSRRYVVGIHDLTGPALFSPCVALGICRDEKGQAVILAVRAIEVEADMARFLALASARGASEAHLHSLAETPAKRAATVADLSDAGRAMTEEAA